MENLASIDKISEQLETILFNLPSDLKIKYF